MKVVVVGGRGGVARRRPVMNPAAVARRGAAQVLRRGRQGGRAGSRRIRLLLDGAWPADVGGLAGAATQCRDGAVAAQGREVAWRWEVVGHGGAACVVLRGGGLPGRRSGP